MKYPLVASSWDEEEIDAARAVLDSGNYTMGENVAKFEQAFAKYMGSDHCVMVNSGSSANLLAIAALFYRSVNPLQRGDEVIVPALSWSTTYFPLYQYGLHLKFVDIDRDTLNYDPDILENAVTEKTRVIVAVNLLGNPNDFDRLGSIILNRDIILVEDNCEALGAEFGESKAGTFGLLGTCSTFFSHHLTTMEGGLVVTNDEELYHIMLSLRAHGWTRQLPKYNLVCGTKSDDDFYESYRFILPGYNLRPLEISGAIGLVQLKKLPAMLAKRRANGETYKRLFRDHPAFSIQKETGISSWFGFAFLLKDGITLPRIKVIASLGCEGIECRPVVAGNMIRNPVMKWLDYSIHERLENADYIDRYGFYVGNHPFDLTDQLILLKEVLDRASRPWCMATTPCAGS